MITEAAGAVVRADDLRRTYRVGDSEVGLWHASFSLIPGDFVAIVGPSGSGKSTLMNLLGLLDTPSAGSLDLFGAAVPDMSESERAAVRSRRIGFVFQSFHLAQRRTVSENVADGLLFAMRHSARPLLVDEALARVGLETRGDQLVDTLSGGERQRVAVARALVKDPPLILADEPTGNLDSASGDHVFSLLKDSARRGAAVVVVTHNPDLASATDRTLRVVDGHLME